MAKIIKWRNDIFIFFCLLFFTCHPAIAKELSCAMILWRGETEAELGFKERLAQLGYQFSYDTYNADQDREKLSSLLRNDINSKLKRYDYIYTFGTTASQMTKGILKQRVPQIFNIVTDPINSRLVKNRDSPGDNISGVSHRIPFTLQLTNARKLTQFRKLAVLFNSREENSNILYFNIKKISKDFGFEVIGLRSPPETQRLELNLKKLVEKSVMVDAVYLPLDSYLVSRAEFIGNELRRAKIMSIGGIEKYISNGATIGTVADYYFLGRLAADIIDKHQKGTPLGKIPFLRPKNPQMVINETSCVNLGIAIPEYLSSSATIVKY
jgi:ABC-type uncharacterized transport system substrate-binding protein